MSFKEVFLKAVDEARNEGDIGPLQAMKARRIANNPARLAKVEAACCEEASAAGFANSGPDVGGFDWNALLAFLKELLPIILALFNVS